MILAIGFMTNTSVQDVFNHSLWSAAGALAASLLCVGLDPIVESLFHLATPSKLLELSNPNQPLLRRLLMEAPGTYHHSIIVANLAEAAAEAIGANPLLARTGAYYHVHCANRNVLACDQHLFKLSTVCCYKPLFLLENRENTFVHKGKRESNLSGCCN